MRCSWFLSAGAAMALAACTTYGTTLVGSGGGGSSGNGAPTGSGGAVACTDVSQCTAMTTDCQKPSCKGGFCVIDYTPMGTAVSAQTAGDCQKLVCDGQGNT